MAELWITKHRPISLDEFVWRDPSMREKIEEWIKEGTLPHLLFSGVPGTGKTSLAYLLLQELKIPSDDILLIPASRERGVEGLQKKLIAFVNAWAFGPSGIKYVFFDEADKLSPTAQDMLRTESETYANSCRFIMTCNHRGRITTALHSRLQEIQFLALDKDSFIMRAADVLEKEKVDFEPEDLLLYTDKTYPDLRKCIGLLDQNTTNGKLNPPRAEDEGTKDYLVDSIEMFKKGKYIEARKLIISQADPDEYDLIYRFFYQNLELFAKNQDDQDAALIIIRNGLVNDQRVGDKEINLAATIAELCMITRH